MPPPLTVSIALVVSAAVAAPPKAGLSVRTLAPELRTALDRRVEQSLGDWVELYKTCHAQPELSLHEKQSAARIARRLERAGFSVTRDFGGHGVVGVMKNGPGPVVLIRTDMDALPIVEETGLPYASRVTHHREEDSTVVGVMHACGHDAHQTILMATAEVLAELKNHWSGTALLIAQPAEEIGCGAMMMINAGLFDRFGRPDACIALHVSHMLETGTVGVTSGWVFANVDSVDITIHGVGGHGAYPHEAVDPIVAAAQVVMALQTIVSRRMNPQHPSVITVGSIHAGTKHNIIPAEARLQLTVRSYTDAARTRLLESIRQVATDVSRAAGCPRPPDVAVIDQHFTPATYNDPALAAAAREVFANLLGVERVIDHPASMGGEDFSQYSRKSGAPGLMFQLGVVDSRTFAASREPDGPRLPPVHSARFKIDPEPTIRTGVRSMCALALSLFGSR